MALTYDENNIFARILRGELPNKTIRETDHTLAFHDLYPQAPVHILVIPKGPYVTFDDFAANASADEIVDFMRVCAEVAKDAGVASITGNDGYRAITNAGPHGVQEIPHFHMHILGGHVVGPMLAPAQS